MLSESRIAGDALKNCRAGEGTDMNLNYLRYFLKLTQVGQYTRAAEEIGITQPSLSHAISQLEEELGVKLFEKDGHHIYLTPYGEKLLRCATDSLDILEEGIGEIHRMAAGDGLVRLGFLRTLGSDYIPRLAADFLKAHPERQVDFDFHTGVTLDLLEGLRDGSYDMIFSSEPQDRTGLECTSVMTQDLVLIVPDGHPLSERYSVALKDTLAYPYVYFKERSGLRYELDRLFRQVGQRPDIVYETEEDQVVAGLVANGFGIALVPYMDLLLKLNIKILQVSSPVCRRDIYLVTDSRRMLMPAAQQFREFVL